MLPYLQANKFDCHAFIDAGRWWLLGQKQRTLVLTTIAIARVSPFFWGGQLFPEPQFPEGEIERARCML